MRIYIASLIVCLCVINNAYGSLDNVFGSWPGEIANAFTSVWKSIKNAVSKPVRIRRLGGGGKRKTTPTTPFPTRHQEDFNTTTVTASLNTTTISSTTVTTSTTTLTTVTSPPETITKGAKTSQPLKLLLPIIATPTWRNIEDWNKLHKPIVGFKAINNNVTSAPDNSSTVVPEVFNGTFKNKAVVADEDEYFGVLMFI